MKKAGVNAVISEDTELEVTCRSTMDCRFYYVINFKDKEIEIPAYFVGKKEILTGNDVQLGEMMNKYDVKIIRIDNVK